MKPTLLESSPEVADIVLQIPPEKWSDKAKRVAQHLSDREQRGLRGRVVTQAMLDLARVEYLELEKEIWSGVCPKTGSSRLTIDFQNVKAFADGTLPMLGAMLAYRSNKQYKTTLILPTEGPDAKRPSRVIDYLRAWNFDQFVEDLTKRPISEFLDRTTLEEWESWTEDRSRYLNLRQDGTADLQVLSARRVALTRIPTEAVTSVHSELTPAARRNRASEVVSPFVAEWTVNTLGTILEQRIVTQQGVAVSEVVGAIILNELLINALVHPAAPSIYVTAQFYQNEEPQEHPYLALSVWDSGRAGKSLSSLLFDASRKGSITSPAFGHISEIYHVWNSDGRYEHRVIGNDADPKRIAKTHRDALVAAPSPGVTSAPHEPGAVPKKLLNDDRVPEKVQGYAGMGLHRVKIAAVRTIGGVLQYAGDSKRMTMRVARCKDARPAEYLSDDEANQLLGDNSYRVDVRTDKTISWPLVGNLWTVWLPIADEQGHSVK